MENGLERPQVGTQRLERIEQLSEQALSVIGLSTSLTERVFFVCSGGLA